MDNPEQCDVCMVDYDEEKHRPRFLPCGHAFCTHCISTIIKFSKISCPTCCQTYTATSATCFPVAYAIEQFVRHVQRIQPIYPVLPSTTDSSGKAQAISKTLQALVQEQHTSLQQQDPLVKEHLQQLIDYDQLLVIWHYHHQQIIMGLSDMLERHKVVVQLLETERKVVEDMKERGKAGRDHRHMSLACLANVTSPSTAISAIEKADECNVEIDAWIQECQKQLPSAKVVRTTMEVHTHCRKMLQQMTSTLAHLTSANVLPPITVPSAPPASLAPPHLSCHTPPACSTPQPAGPSHKTAAPNPDCSLLLSTPPAAGASSPVQSIIHKTLLITQQYQPQRDACMTTASPLEVKLSNCLSSLQGEERQLVAEKHIENKTYYAGLSIHLHALVPTPPSPAAHVLKHKYLWSSTAKRIQENPFTTVFLDLRDVEKIQPAYRIYIRLDMEKFLAVQFLMLCTGVRGHSYADTPLLGVLRKGAEGECVVGGDYELKNGKGGCPIIKDVEKDKSSWQVLDVGAVTSLDPKSKKSSQFCIITRKTKSVNAVKLGEVVSGVQILEDLKERISKKLIKVTSCGVVLNM